MAMWIIPYVCAAILAAMFAVPIVSFLFLVFTFGLGYFVLFGFGLIALLGPFLILIHFALAQFRGGSPRSVWITVNVWICSLIVHAGASHGQSRWGDVGSVMGAKNSTYTEAFFSPLVFISNRLNLQRTPG